MKREIKREMKTKMNSRARSSSVRGTLACFAALSAFVVACGSDDSSDTGETIVKPPQGSPGDDEGRPVPTEELTFSDGEASDIESRFANEVEPRARFTFDSGLLPQQALAVKKDLLEIVGMRFADVKPPLRPLVPAKIREDAKGAFGTADASGILRYVSERVKVFLGAEPKAGLLEGEALFPYGSVREDEKAYMTAANFGTLVWYEALIRKQPGAAFGLTATYPVKSMRDGLISIQPGYNLVALPSDGRGSVVRVRLAGAGTLVHEARHSDCSEALAPADIERIRKNGGDVLSGNTQCGHLHVKCPAGHELEGINACDDHAWGAYSLSYVYSAFVAAACESCADFDVKVAALSAIDAYSRVLTFPKPGQSSDGATGLEVPLTTSAVLPSVDMSHKETPAL